MSRFCVPLWLLAIIASNSIAWSADRTVTLSQAAGSVPRYDIVEVTLSVTNPVAANPFWDASVSASFGKVGATKLTVDGFCDSADGTLYRVRFCPREVGDHEFDITFTDGAGSKTFSGTFSSTAGSLPGFLRHDPEHPMHFVWEGTGAHVYPIGNTVYGIIGLTSMTEIKSNIDYFKAKGVNRLRFQNFAHWIDGEFGLIFDATMNRIINPFAGSDYSRYDVAHWKKMEEMLRYLRDRQMIASVIMVIDRGKSNFPSAGSLNEDRYYRYAVARYASFCNVTFDLGNEHNEYRSVPSWANRLGTLMHGWNPYDNLISAHAYATHSYKNATGTEWCGWQEFQKYGTVAGLNGHLIANRNAPQPLINEEYGYEGTSTTTDNHGQNYDRVRQKTWALACAGGYSTYGVWSSGEFVSGRISGGKALKDGYFNHLTHVFSPRSWWLMEPMNALVSAGFCLARPGVEYVVYQPIGGSFTVDLTGSSASFTATWTNPSTGATIVGGTIVGGAIRSFSTPNSSDWVLTLISTTAGDNSPPSAPSTLTAQVIDSRRIDLTWSAASDGESGIIKYRIYRGAGGATPVVIATIGATSSYQDTTVQPSTGYTYRVSAVNGADMEGLASGPANATTPAGNALPAATDATLTTVEDTSVGFVLSATDPEGNAITRFQITSAPSKGTITSFDVTTGTGTYVPGKNENGSDSFTFAASDDGGVSYGAAATVTITITAVNDAPVVVPQTFRTNKNTQVNTQLAIEDPDGPGPFSYEVVDQPDHGTLDGINNDQFYLPAAGFVGTDSFSWRVYDGIEWSATVTYTIEVVDPPTTSFYRAINLNGPAATIDGQAWEGKTTTGYVYTGKVFEKQSVTLVPSTDPARAQMIRSCVYDTTNGSSVTMTGVPDGQYEVFLYVWEDNASETFDITLEGIVVADEYASGSAGSWQRLGPWPVTIGDGTIAVRCTAGKAAALSGIEVWRVNAPPANQTPTLSAGPDRTVTMPTLAALDGSANDDGLPSGSTLSVAWSKVSGPGTVVFGTGASVDTSASFSAAGTYVLRLTASDGSLSASDDVLVTVQAASGGGNLIGSVSTATGKPLIVGVLAVGETLYIDRSYSFSSVPASFVDAEYVRTANNDKGNTGSAYLSFTLTSSATVFIAYDSRTTTLPAWLSGWTSTGLTIGTSDFPRKVFAREFAAGSVTLGGNLQAPAAGARSMYSVFAIPSSSYPQ